MVRKEVTHHQGAKKGEEKSFATGHEGMIHREVREAREEGVIL